MELEKVNSVAQRKNRNKGSKAEKEELGKQESNKTERNKNEKLTEGNRRCKKDIKEKEWNKVGWE